MGSSSVRPARAPGERRATTAGGLAGPPGHATTGPAEYLDIARDCRALERVVAWDMGNRQVARDGPPENLFSAFFWGDAFATLGVRPAAGRGFTADEIRKGERVAVVSHRYWSSRLASDASLVGERLLVNGEPYTLVGVMPPGTLLYVRPFDPLTVAAAGALLLLLAAAASDAPARRASRLDPVAALREE